ncbi:MAG: hypothetical protein U9P72_06600 [Campylobacterota bacterium]|nr:hypothetical protein [Campylobacterota bacterium]
MILDNKLGITNQIELAKSEEKISRELFMKGIDISYYYEGYSLFKTEEL